MDCLCGIRSVQKFERLSAELLAESRARADEGRVRHDGHEVEALGEHGFPGLILYLLIGLMTWRVAARLAKSTRDDPEFSNWVPLLVRMVQVALVGFAVGGAFLSLMHLDVVYYIVGFVVLADATVREAKQVRERNARPAEATPAHTHSVSASP